MLFGPGAGLPAEPSDDRLDEVLADIKRHARHRRLALVAPLALVAAVVSAFVANPDEYGGLTPDAEASDVVPLPRVFGADGRWFLPEPITDARPTQHGPPVLIGSPSAPDAPSFVLTAPSDVSPSPSAIDLPVNRSLPASASSPPAPTLGQSLSSDDPVDFGALQPEIRLDPTPASAESESAPAPSAPAEAEPTPDLSADADTDVTGASPEAPDTSGDISDSMADAMEPLVADAGDPAEANPSTPQPDLADDGAGQPDSEVATIVPESVLVHSAHVSVTVRVVDGDSSVIDWCNTRVDWGDGSVTGLLGSGEVATCAASCESVATPSEVGVDLSLVFEHEYSSLIDAAPRVFVATGDGCTYNLAELQLNPFTVVP